MSEPIELKKILTVIQEPIQIESRPFDRFAERLGIPVERVLIMIREYIEEGIIRRFAGIVKHNLVGYEYNAMVAFEVELQQCDACGERLSKLSYVTHCYRRASYPDWPYNLYAMMHARNPDEYSARIVKMKSLFEWRSVEIMRSVKEYKKSLYHLKM